MVVQHVLENINGGLLDPRDELNTYASIWSIQVVVQPLLVGAMLTLLHNMVVIISVFSDALGDRNRDLLGSSMNRFGRFSSLSRLYSLA